MTQKNVYRKNQCKECKTVISLRCLHAIYCKECAEKRLIQSRLRHKKTAKGLMQI